MLSKYKNIFLLFVCLIAIFQTYLFTMYPVFKNNDSPETITSSYTLGIGHPPGYPLFTMAGKIFTLVPLASPAFRMNVFASFIAIVILLFSYFIIKQNIHVVLDDKNRLINYIFIFVQGFSFIFWNQAIEAKGGIYMLNLLVLAIMLYLSVELFKRFNARQLYLMAFVYGLSLSNHYPSMIILLPVFGYLFIKYRQRIGMKNCIWLVFFLITGLSPYFYLPIRSGTDGIFVFMARPNTLENFWWTIFRGAYTYIQAPTMDMYKGQIKEFIMLFLNNFSLIWILIFFGGFVLFKKKREILLFYAAAFLIIVYMVVIYNRSERIFYELIDIFLMPSQYIEFIFAAIGACFIFKMLNENIYKYIFITVLGLITIYSGFIHYKINNNRYNYIAYDFGNNAIKTIKPGSFYIPKGDIHVMPMSYFQDVEHRTDNIKYLLYTSLQYKWGINDFTGKYGGIGLEVNSQADSMIRIISNFISHNNIYTSLYLSEIEHNLDEYAQRADGVLFRIAKKDEYISPNVFKNYSYRGIYAARAYYDKALLTFYSERMSLQGDDLLNQKRYKEAIIVFKKALCMPVINYETNIYYDLSLAYKAVKDEDDEIECLKKAIEKQANFWQAYEALGKIYYENKLYPMAEDMLENAILYNSLNKQVLQNNIDIMNKTGDMQFDTLFKKAAVLYSKGDYMKALDIYDFLISKKYREADIYTILGVENFNKKDYKTALDYFIKGKDINKNAGIYIHIAETYYNMKKIDEALATLKEAISALGKDQQLTGWYEFLTKEKKKGSK